MTLVRPTRRALLRAGLVAGLAPALPAWAQDAATDTGTDTGAGTDAEAGTAARTVEVMATGAEDAPVTVIEYASLTCPHCARFQTDVYPRLNQNYIEPGKVRFIVRDVYFDRLGLWAAMVARCGGADKYFGIVDRLYQKQGDWSRKETAQEALAAMFAIGRQAGLTDDAMQDCVQDQAWAEALVAEFQKNMEADQVEGTPTFFIDGEKQPNMPYDEFAARLDEALGS
ncbi:thioredoxin domain-containing protein [Rhodobacteraceae bacterium 2CG4]|uniref:Thioredoxin domain-containing protein n=1 Tax=Halovulum marinum TaxID=2662447 RepID=A0A6L5Z2G2_9RHOB|nr:DsbA family protein [Halovulum marinum]MSU90718.1 thioredoxin domain-containing protein [Halovulum marinum]